MLTPMTPRLVTIPMSHYCEKARWALDRAGIAYVEEIHAPLISRLSARGTVPALVTDDGTFGDSTDILRWVDRRQPLFRDDAAALEERFDTELGPPARNLSILLIAPDRALSRRVALWGVPGWERFFGSLFFGAALAYLKRMYGMRHDTPVVALEALRRLFADVSARLADGRRYLCGGELGAADITFAALAAPVILPESEKSRLPRLHEVGPELRAVVEELRATPAGAFVLRLYAEDRA